MPAQSSHRMRARSTPVEARSRCTTTATAGTRLTVRSRYAARSRPAYTASGSGRVTTSRSSPCTGPGSGPSPAADWATRAGTVRRTTGSRAVAASAVTAAMRHRPSGSRPCGKRTSSSGNSEQETGTEPLEDDERQRRPRQRSGPTTSRSRARRRRSASSAHQTPNPESSQPTRCRGSRASTVAPAHAITSAAKQAAQTGSSSRTRRCAAGTWRSTSAAAAHRAAVTASTTAPGRRARSRAVEDAVACEVTHTGCRTKRPGVLGPASCSRRDIGGDAGQDTAP